jgi:hypothetical protein
MPVATGNETQLVTVTDADGGTFTLTYAGQTTAAIAFDAAAATVDTRLTALSNIGASDVGVTGDAGGPWTVEFTGTLQDTDVALMTADGASLTGEGAEVAVTTASAGNPAAGEIVYVDISDVGGKVANLEVLPGQTPPPGHARVSKADYYA